MRRASKLTQEQVAKASGISASVVSEVETGKRRPSRSDSRDGLVRWAQVVDADPVRVLELAGHLPRRDVVTVRKRPPLEEFIATDPTLTADQRAALLAVLGVIRERRREEGGSHR